MGSGNSATSIRDPAGARKRTRKFVLHTPRTREQWREDGGRDGGGRGQRTERGDRVRPQGEKLLSARFLPGSEAESVSLREKGRGRNKQSKREETAEGRSRGVRGKPSQRKRQRAESAKERTRRGCGTAPGRAEVGGDPWGRVRTRWRQEVLGHPAHAHGVLTVPGGPCGRGSPAGLRCAGTGRLAAGRESARLRSGGGEQNLRS